MFVSMSVVTDVFTRFCSSSTVVGESQKVLYEPMIRKHYKQHLVTLLKCLRSPAANPTLWQLIVKELRKMLTLKAKRFIYSTGRTVQNTEFIS